MKFRNPCDKRVEHDFPRFRVRVEPGETIDIPEKWAPFLTSMASVLVPFDDAPEPEPEPAADPRPTPVAMKAAPPAATPQEPAAPATAPTPDAAEPKAAKPKPKA